MVEAGIRSAGSTRNLDTLLRDTRTSAWLPQKAMMKSVRRSKSLAARAAGDDDEKGMCTWRNHTCFSSSLVAVTSLRKTSQIQRKRRTYSRIRLELHQPPRDVERANIREGSIPDSTGLARYVAEKEGVAASILFFVRDFCRHRRTTRLRNISHI